MNLNSKKWLWTGRILSALSAAFLLFDVIIHIAKPSVVIQSFEQGGYSLNVIMPVALVELVCVVLYIIPRTSVLGAILLTGYLGGAVDYNVRAGNPLFTGVLFPVYVAIVLWAGLYLRDSKVRTVVF
jgi:hypothetical protein